MAARWELRLPSEAQWEYGARGGTASVYWSGSGVEDLQGVADVEDHYSKANGAPSHTNFEEKLDDGFTLHAPVDAFVPNAIGLHNVHGNVQEWCMDGFYDDFYSDSAFFNPLGPPEGSAFRAARGGSFFGTAKSVRPAIRSGWVPPSTHNLLGLRPVRVIVK